jgi:hypothetical protein
MNKPKHDFKTVHSRLEIEASQGFSINQAGRLLGLKGTQALRAYLKKHPDLYKQFLENGRDRSCFRTVNQKEKADE